MKKEKVLTLLGSEYVEKIDAMDSQGLHEMIVQSEQAIKEAKEQMEANPNYQDLKEKLSAFRAGFSELKKFQSAKIQYSLDCLENFGKTTSTTNEN